MHEGAGNIGVLGIGGFRAEKRVLVFSGRAFLFARGILMFILVFVFPQDGYFFSKIWSILKKTLGILCEHH